MTLSLHELPHEILEHICSFLDLPEDLLSFGLTCRFLCNFVIPYQVQFRHIRCDPRRRDVVEALMERPTLGHAVRRLELVSNEASVWPTRPLLPRSLAPSSASKMRKALDRAFVITDVMPRLMYSLPLLKRFVWVPTQIKRNREAVPEVVMSVASCPFLEELELSYDEAPWFVGKQFSIVAYP
ncbi:hypothetical protein M422DRAFT_252978 [Sphaerobolus stellatus SS14]|uniref:F-box domain-containing protein n=1 Tax=Sphaerobolus stellatus (strain SS14) TaxID=990650 RepID=A0A0C9VYX6_SPHS4|nr:hypothetical protein M422DRAFT_252978 [Sphaerobolus stellatus SS14]